MSLLDARTALRGLEAKGLIGHVPGTSHRFQPATPPDEAFRPLIQRRRADLRAMRSDVDVLAEEYRDGRSRRPGEHVDAVAGDAARHAARLVATATVEVCTLVTNTTHVRPASGARPRPGVVERAVYPRSALACEDERCEIDASMHRGVQIRVVDRPAFAMLAVDRSLMVVAMAAAPAPPAASADRATTGGALLVHTGGLLDSLLAVFDRTWSIAQPLRSTPNGLACGDPSVTVPCPDDLRLLTLLLDGLTDEAIATKLDLGTRTVQRRVRELIEATGVRTRLQLIWQATVRGWI